MEIDEKISEFIKEHHVMTLAFQGDDGLWCANAFYAYDEKLPGFVVTSEEKTRHISMLKKDENGNVLPESALLTGSIVLETEKVGMIRGLQFRVRIRRGDNSLLSRSRLLYLKRFPYAVLNGSDLWTLELLEMKYTDNRLGFGKKLLWKNEH